MISVLLTACAGSANSVANVPNFSTLDAIVFDVTGASLDDLNSAALDAQVGLVGSCLNNRGFSDSLAHEMVGSRARLMEPTRLGGIVASFRTRAAAPTPAEADSRSPVEQKAFRECVDQSNMSFSDPATGILEWLSNQDRERAARVRAEPAVSGADRQRQHCIAALGAVDVDGQAADSGEDVVAAISASAQKIQGQLQRHTITANDAEREFQELAKFERAIADDVNLCDNEFNRLYQAEMDHQLGLFVEEHADAVREQVKLLAADNLDVLQPYLPERTTS